MIELTDQVSSDLCSHEGFVPHAYQDHLGYWTIGIGRLIDERRGGGISEDEARYLLRNDIDRIVSRLQREQGYRDAPDIVRRALVNMAYQLGVTGLLGFGKMWAALEQQNYSLAAEEALDSVWAKQTPTRAREVASWIRSG